MRASEDLQNLMTMESKTKGCGVFIAAAVLVLVEVVRFAVFKIFYTPTVTGWFLAVAASSVISLSSVLLMFSNAREKWHKAVDLCDARISDISGGFARRCVNRNRFYCSANLVKGVVFFCSGAVVALISFSFFFYFDMSDESLHLYCLIHGGENKPLFLTTFYTFFHNIGALFGHSLLGYRFLGLFSVVAASIAWAVWVLKYVCRGTSMGSKAASIFCGIVLIHSLFFYSFTSTSFSYYTVALLSSFIWATGMVMLFYAMDEYDCAGQNGMWFVRKALVPVLAISFAALLAFTARIPQACAQVAATVLMIVAFSRRRTICRNFVSAAIFLFFVGAMTLCYIGFNWSIVRQLPRLYEVASLQELYEIEVVFRRFIDMSFSAALRTRALILLIPFALLFMFSAKKVKNFRNAVAIFSVLSAVFILFIVLQNAWRTFDSYVLHQVTVNSMVFVIYLGLTILSVAYFFMFSERKGALRSRVIASAVAVSASFMFAIGSSLSFHALVASALGLFSMPFLIMLLDSTKRFSFANWYTIMVTVLFFAVESSYILSLHVIRACHTSKLFLQTHQSQSKYLRHINIEENFVTPIDNFINALHKIGFNFKSDRVFVFPFASGFLAASGVKALGCVWNADARTNYLWRGIDDCNCAFLDIDRKDESIRNVYILLLSEKACDYGTESANSCFDRFCRHASNMKVKSIFSDEREYRKAQDGLIDTKNLPKEFKLLLRMLRAKKDLSAMYIGDMFFYNTLRDVRDIWLIGPYELQMK